MNGMSHEKKCQKEMCSHHHGYICLFRVCNLNCFIPFVKYFVSSFFIGTKRYRIMMDDDKINIDVRQTYFILYTQKMKSLNWKVEMCVLVARIFFVYCHTLNSIKIPHQKMEKHIL